MKNCLLLFSVVLFLTACSDDKNAGGPPPKELVGHWVAVDDAQALQFYMNNKAAAGDCSGFQILSTNTDNVQAPTIELSLAEIKDNGTVFTVEEVVKGQPVTPSHIATVNSSNSITVSPAFANQIGALSKAAGVSVQYSFGLQLINSNTLVLTSTFVVNGQTTKEESTFTKVSEDQYNEQLARAQRCVNVEPINNNFGLPF